MTTWKRRISFTLAGVLAVILAIIVVGEIVSRVKFSRRYVIPTVALAIPTDSASLHRGRTLAEVYGCTGCHTATLRGEVMFSAFPLVRVAPTNLTPGQGGIGRGYSVADWERAIRHGIGADGRKLLVMPSNQYSAIQDADLAQLIAYLMSLPPIDGAMPSTTLWPIGRVLHAANVDLVSAEKIDHAARPREVAPGVTAEYGAYLSTPCQVCHSRTFGGGKTPDPDSPPAPNIAKGTAASMWSDSAFIATIRTGTTPDGRQLRNEYMPWRSFARMTDDELRAIWMYLQSLSR